jgi:hypothetical protein
MKPTYDIRIIYKNGHQQEVTAEDKELNGILDILVKRAEENELPSGAFQICVTKKEHNGLFNSVSDTFTAWDVDLGRLIGVEEASNLWGLAPGTIKNYCASGKIISTKIGNTWVIFKDQPNPAKSSR